MRNSIGSFILLSTLLFPLSSFADDFKDAMSQIEQGECKDGINKLTKLASENAVGALINLGHFYETGTCVERNLSKADNYFKAAAELDHPLGHYRYGLLHFGDKSFKPDHHLVFREWSRALEQGLDIRSELSILYLTGSGVDRDITKAESLLIGASKNGDELAKERLRELYSDPNGPLYNLEKANAL